MSIKVLISLLMIILLCNVVAIQSVFAQDMTSYIYYRRGNTIEDYHPVPAPSPYNYIKSIYAKELGVDGLYNINSLYVSENYVYISCGRGIIITDHDFNTKHVITEIITEKGQEQLTEINGLWVTDEEELYACEPNKGRILHFDSDYKIKRVLERPEGIILSKDIAYQPLKVAVDSIGRIYVVANNIYEGLVEINPDGTFSRYFGVVEIKYSPIQLFWRRFQTRAQRARSREWLPVNFNNVAIDNEDFVYATVAGSGSEEPIRKLNAKGKNILRYPISTEIKPQGDLSINQHGQTIPTGKSILRAIDINDYGIYVVLDTKRSRIFAYDSDGYMLYAFGDRGTTTGRFKNPVDIKFMGEDKLLVADRGNMCIEVLELNDYGKSIHEAVRYQAEFNYNLSAKEWEKVIDYNPAFQYAYVGIGKAIYRNEDPNSAIKYFLHGQDTYYYSKAYEIVREEFISDNFGIIMAVIVMLIIVRMTWKRVNK